MITVRLTGGLGNQMFQYAAGKRLADERGVALRLDVGVLANAETPRSFELGAFAIDAEIHRESRARQLVNRVERRLRISVLSPVVITEASFSCDPRILDAPDGSYLVGYFQSPRYFEGAEAAVRRSFTLTERPLTKAEEIVRTPENGTAVSVHVRRGDYVSAPGASRVHGVLPVSYYQEACERVLQRCPDAHFFVFSDDPEWCKENMTRIAPRVTCIDPDAETTAARDMWLMASCRHHVIANSTFSWWSAWLNPSPEKLVIAPRGWFIRRTVDISDLFPADWVLL